MLDQMWKKLNTIWTKPRIAPYKHTWRAHHNTVYWCNLKLAQRKGVHFSQTRSHAITLSSTLPAICIEKMVCMKTVEELYCKVCQSPQATSRNTRAELATRSEGCPYHGFEKSDDRENEIHKHKGDLCK